MHLVAIKSHFAKIVAMPNETLNRGLNLADATGLLGLWTRMPAPRSVITSPPYLDMHDYGSPAQIGVRGQKIEGYLDQMHTLLSNCHRISTNDATLWLVAGPVRRNKRLIPLPDRLVSCAEDAGWTLRESITWDKQKALPWTHHGELRDITEQVLLFSKTDEFQFNAVGTAFSDTQLDLVAPIP